MDEEMLQREGKGAHVCVYAYQRSNLSEDSREIVHPLWFERTDHKAEELAVQVLIVHVYHMWMVLPPIEEQPLLPPKLSDVCTKGIDFHLICGHMDIGVPGN